VLFVADLAGAKKAKDIVILDMRKISNITDFFIIATAVSARQAQAITDNIERGLLELKEPICGTEGREETGWVLVDAYDVVVHIFNASLRRFYNLEGLWSDAPRVRLCQKKKRKTSKKTSKRK
jgi:ribosome-associated protein